MSEISELFTKLLAERRGDCSTPTAFESFPNSTPILLIESMLAIGAYLIRADGDTAMQQYAIHLNQVSQLNPGLRLIYIGERVASKVSLLPYPDQKLHILKPPIFATVYKYNDGRFSGDDYVATLARPSTGIDFSRRGK